METSITALDKFTLAIAAYAALVSTFVAGRGYWKDRRKIKVKCQLTEKTRLPNGEYEDLMIGVRAVNSGHRVVTLRLAGFITTGGQTHWFGHRKLPCVLGDGEEVVVQVSLDSLISKLTSFDPGAMYKCAFFADSSGKKYTTRKLATEMVEAGIAK